MAINKKLIHFKTKQKFNEELANGNILETSIVFIQDTTEIYTHGQLYDGSKVDLSNIEEMISKIKTDGDGLMYLNDKGEYEIPQIICIKFTNKTANAWIEDPTYSNFKYKCDIACEGVTTDMYAEVVFNVDQAVSGNYSPVCETGNGIVTIWSSVTDSITIPTIIITE